VFGITSQAGYVSDVKQDQICLVVYLLDQW